MPCCCCARARTTLRQNQSDHDTPLRPHAAALPWHCVASPYAREYVGRPSCSPVPFDCVGMRLADEA
eukprot:3901814-Pleurochrysis_carterae.AAC.2